VELLSSSNLGRSLNSLVPFLKGKVKLRSPMVLIGALFFVKSEIKVTNGAYWCPVFPEN